MIKYQDWKSGELDRVPQDYGEYPMNMADAGDELDTFGERLITDPF